VSGSSNDINDYTSSCSGGIASAVNGDPTGDPTTDIPSSVVGGTSAASPVFAGIVALLNQYVVSKGIQSTPGLGNINTRLYQLAASSSSPFHKVNTGDNMVYCQVGFPEGEPSGVICPSSGVIGFEASASDSKTGYNLVTGLGSVDAGNLLTAWAATSTSATTTTVTSSLNPAPSGTNVTFTATVTTVGTHPPTGTVTFYNGTTSIGTGTLSTVSGSQVATLTASTLPVGSDSITAVYGG